MALSTSEKIVTRLEGLLRRLSSFNCDEDTIVEPVRLRVRIVFASRCCEEFRRGEMSSAVLLQFERRLWKWSFHSRSRKTSRWLREAIKYYESLDALPKQRQLMRLGDLARYSRRAHQCSPKTAASLYARAIAEQPHDGSGYNALGVLLAAEGQPISAAYFYARAASCRQPFRAADANLASLSAANDAVARIGLSLVRCQPDLEGLRGLLRAAKLSRRLAFELAVVAIYLRERLDLHAIAAAFLQAAPYRPATLPALVILSDWFAIADRRPAPTEVVKLPERLHLVAFEPFAPVYASLCTEHIEPDTQGHSRLLDKSDFGGARLDHLRREEIRRYWPSLCRRH